MLGQYGDQECRSTAGNSLHLTLEGQKKSMLMFLGFNTRNSFETSMKYTIIADINCDANQNLRPERCIVMERPGSYGRDPAWDVNKFPIGVSGERTHNLHLGQ
jgi:hypothetical protein